MRFTDLQQRWRWSVRRRGRGGGNRSRMVSFGAFWSYVPETDRLYSDGRANEPSTSLRIDIDHIRFRPVRTLFLLANPVRILLFRYSNFQSILVLLLLLLFALVILGVSTWSVCRELGSTSWDRGYAKLDTPNS